MDQFERIRRIAFFSIGRACMFGLLAIFTVTFALVTWPVMAAKAAALLVALAWAVLLLKAYQSKRRSYRSSETWILMGRKHGYGDEVQAQRVISNILCDTFTRFALYAGLIALGLMALAGAFWLLGLSTGPSSL